MDQMHETVAFEGRSNRLSGVLHVPGSEVKAGVVLAHCFTCSKSYKVVRHLAKGIAEGGYAVLRFDFTGLGESEGDFGETSLTTNVDDLVAAAEYMQHRGFGSCTMVGHSLGGTATLLAAANMPQVRAVAVVASPATADHVRRHFGAAEIETARETGRVRVEIAGRPFDISADFFQDLERHTALDHVTALGRPLLVVHSTADRIVGIEQGERIFAAARQPRWFAAIPGADHLFTNTQLAGVAARTIAAFLDAALP